MNNKDDHSNLFRLLAGANETPSFNRFAHLAALTQPKSNPSVPRASLAGLLGPYRQPPKPKPPHLSVDHMKQMIEASITKKLDVNPGRQLPTIYDLAIGEGRKLNAAFVYTDLDGYSKMVSTKGTGIAFKLLQAFVDLTARITDHFNGVVVDCAGDRTLSVFYRADTDHSTGPIREATTAALWIQTAMVKVVSPRFSALQLPDIKASIGIDYGTVIAGCVGVRGNKRLVFFGDAANQAAKLQDEGAGGETVISPLVFHNKPSYLKDTSWIFHAEPDPFNYYTVRYYKTANYFVADVPIAKETYLI